MSASWKSQKERSNTFWIQLLLTIGLRFGRPLARLILLPTVAYFMLTSGQARRHSRLYLERVFERPVTWRQIARHFYWFASTVLDRFFLHAGHTSPFSLDIHGAEIFDHLIAEKRGALLMTSHFGSFDCLRVAADQRTDPMALKMVMDVAHGGTLIKVLEKHQPQWMDAVIDSGGAPTDLVLRVREALDDACMVGMMVDRIHDPRERSVTCEFLGHQTQVPATPWLLALVLRVPVILCVGIYHGKGHYSVHLETLLDGSQKVHRRDRNTFAEKQAQRYMNRLEEFACEHPYNWFNFYDYWATSEALESAPPSGETTS